MRKVHDLKRWKGYVILEKGYFMLDKGYFMLEKGYVVLEKGYVMLDKSEAYSIDNMIGGLQRKWRGVGEEQRKFRWEAVCWNHVIFPTYTGASQGYATRWWSEFAVARRPCRIIDAGRSSSQSNTCRTLLEVRVLEIRSVNCWWILLIHKLLASYYRNPSTFYVPSCNRTDQ